MATVTITTTPAEDARIVVAFGKMLNLGRNATAPEIKADVIRYMISVVNNQDFVTAQQSITLTPISPT